MKKTSTRAKLPKGQSKFRVSFKNEVKYSLKARKEVFVKTL